MNPFRKPFSFSQPAKKEPSIKARSCKRIIKRDEQGRITREEFIGCSKDEIRSFRDVDNIDKENKDEY